MLASRLVARATLRNTTPYPLHSTSHFSARSKWTQPSHSFSQTYPQFKDKPQIPPSENPSMPAFNLFHLLRGANRSVRYTVFGVLGVLTAAECTFWLKVIQYKFFSPDEEASEEFFKEVHERIKHFRLFWIGAYGRYYGETIWGL